MGSETKRLDPFLSLSRTPRQRPGASLAQLDAPGLTKGHSIRAHSKYSASGAERWMNCPGSVALSEGIPDKSTPWSIEGTLAHEVLEAVMKLELSGNDGADVEEYGPVISKAPGIMVSHAKTAAEFIFGKAEKLRAALVEVETRIYLKFIHPEMFGTYDGAVVDHFGTLHVFDYKYGAGHFVSPKKNLQMIFYGVGLAAKYQWNFKRVKLWIIQPRVKGYDGPLFWELSVPQLMRYVPLLRQGVERVENDTGTYREGSWCHWCKAKSICPLKLKAKTEAAKAVFGLVPWKGN